MIKERTFKVHFLLILWLANSAVLIENGNFQEPKKMSWAWLYPSQRHAHKKKKSTSSKLKGCLVLVRFVIFALNWQETDSSFVLIDATSCTANVLSAEYTDVCLRSKFNNKHWLFLHVFICNGQQIFSCCFYFESNTKFTEK